MQKKPDLKSIGDRIRELRGTVTRKKFSEMFSIPVTSLARWEAGDSQPDLTYLVRLAGYFQVTLEWIVTGAPQKPNMDFCDQQLSYLDKFGWPGYEETCDASQVQKTQHTENIEPQEADLPAKPATVAAFIPATDEVRQLERKLREALEKNSALSEEKSVLVERNADLRIEIERLKYELAAAVGAQEKATAGMIKRTPVDKAG